MKNLIFILLLMPFISKATEGPTLEAITRAISAGDADALGRFLDESVQIAILDEEDIYDRPEAVAALKSFFAKNKPKSFSQVHQGNSKDNSSQYCIGSLSSGAANYRVYMYLKVVGGNYIIQELRFDKE